MLRIAVTKGKVEKEFFNLLDKASYDVKPLQNKDRQLLIKTKDNIEFIFAKANDVITFVEHGVVDLGIVGSDTIAESISNDFYELLDLKISKCYFALASFEDFNSREFKRRKIIASKYPNISKAFFCNKNEDVEIIKIDGSVELGPIVGLSDAIVDIVETGNTLKANGLKVIENVMNVSARLIANKVSYKFKSKSINKIINDLEVIINNE